MIKTIFITGANRGLGFAFVQHYLNQGWHIIATCRNPDRAIELKQLQQAHQDAIEIYQLDVTVQEQIATIAQTLADRPIDILLNNAGIFGPSGLYLGDLNEPDWLQVLRANTIAPILITQALLKNVIQGQEKIIAVMSSRVGSITDNCLGRRYYYRSSKAALNMAIKSLSIDLKEQGIIAVALHPGWVQTDMGGEGADLTPTKSARRLEGILSHLRIEDTGKFLSHDSSELPW